MADFLVHVLDASQPEVFAFHKTTMDVLAELGAKDKRVITVFNKIDLLGDDDTTPNMLRRHFPDALVHLHAHRARASTNSSRAWRSNSPADRSGWSWSCPSDRGDLLSRQPAPPRPGARHRLRRRRHPCPRGAAGEVCRGFLVPYRQEPSRAPVTRRPRPRPRALGAGRRPERFSDRSIGWICDLRIAVRWQNHSMQAPGAPRRRRSPAELSCFGVLDIAPGGRDRPRDAHGWPRRNAFHWAHLSLVAAGPATEWFKSSFGLRTEL